VLGVLSVIGGFVMVPRFISGFAPFEDFLAPVFTSAPTRLLIATDGHQTLEIYFAIIALVVATAGWYLADACYRTHKFDPLVLSDFAGVFYRLSFNKYYVDEFYHLVVVQPYMLGTRVLAWFDLNIVDGLVNLAAAVTLIGSWTSGLINLYVVDGLVNLAANATLAACERIRRLQTGSVNAYLYGILATVMIILLVRAILSV
jgi:NADH-quinone oxidoreductase subunit L